MVVLVSNLRLGYSTPLLVPLLLGVPKDATNMNKEVGFLRSPSNSTASPPVTVNGVGFPVRVISGGSVTPGNDYYTTTRYIYYHNYNLLLLLTTTTTTITNYYYYYYYYYYY